MPKLLRADALVNVSRKISRPIGLAEEVYGRIRSDIMSLRLLPDTRVTVDSLSRELGVSQTPVREALSMLESDGLVVKRQFAGYCTPPPMNRAQLDNLFEFRLLVEPHLAMRAATRISEEALARLLEITRTRGASHEDSARLDAEFHGLIAEQAGNRLIAESLNGLHIHIHIFRSCFRAEIAREAFQEHRKIGQAIAARDGEAAGATMCDHIERSYDRLLNFLRAEDEVDTSAL